MPEALALILLPGADCDKLLDSWPSAGPGKTVAAGGKVGAVSDQSAPSNVIRPELMEILACPESKAPLVQVGDHVYSTDPKTRRRYAVRDGIPNMLIDESEVVSEEEFGRIMAEANVKTAQTQGESEN